MLTATAKSRLEKENCDPLWKNVPKVAKTTIEIWLKVGNNSIFNKYLKPIFINPHLGLLLYEFSNRLVAHALA